MKGWFLLILVFLLGATMLGQKDNSELENEVTKVEEEFGQAMIKNDADKIGSFLSDDWIIVDPEGGIIDKARFLIVIRSGALTHEAMDSADVRVRIYGGSTAVVTALTSSKAKYMGQELSTRERTTDVFVKQGGQWQCVVTHLTTFSKKTAELHSQ